MVSSERDLREGGVHCIRLPGNVIIICSLSRRAAHFGAFRIGHMALAFPSARGDSWLIIEERRKGFPAH